MQQLTCNIDLSNSFDYLFFSFVLIELKPFVLKGKVLGEIFWKSVKMYDEKCENYEKSVKIMKRFCPLVVALYFLSDVNSNLGVLWYVFPSPEISTPPLPLIFFLRLTLCLTGWGAGRHALSGTSLIFLSLLFWETARKTTKKKQGFFILSEPLKSLEKKGKTRKKARNSLETKRPSSDTFHIARYFQR